MAFPKCTLWACLIVLFSLARDAGAQRSISADNDVLLEFTRSIDNWHAFSVANSYNWTQSLPTCLWRGVTCSNEGRVIQLSLQCDLCAVQAEGTLPASLVGLADLETLNLQYNKFYSSLPSGWGSGFSKLQNLFVNSNSLNGTLPTNWGEGGSFSSLVLLRADNNDFAGPLPSWNNSFQNLLVMRLHANDLTGTLPPEWGSSGLSRIQIISLQRNSLSGPLPIEWGGAASMQQLSELYLQSNALTGTLPVNWGSNASFPRLQFLSIGSNEYSGELPDGWGTPGAFKNLGLFDLSHARLSGTLPASWGDSSSFAKMYSLALQNNNLTGTIPRSWSGLGSMQFLFLRPGNYYLCPPVPEAPFSVCDADELTCESSNVDLNDSIGCSPPPDVEASPFPVAAVAAPVAAVLSLVLLALLLLLWRRQRDRYAARVRSLTSASDADGGKPANAFGTGGHPFVGPASRAPGPASAADAAADMEADVEALEAMAAAAAAPPPGRAARWLDAAGGFLFGSIYPVHALGPLDPSDPASSSAAGASGSLGVELAAGRASRRGESGGAGGGGSSAPRAPLDGRSASLAPEASASGAAGPEAALSDWEIAPGEVQILKRPNGADWQLGSGGFGTVFKALHNGVQVVAVKMLNPGPETDGSALALPSFRHEVAILKACRDANVVQFVGACLRDGMAMLVTEYCEGGNLANNIAAGRVTWARRGRQVALGVAKGLVFLHSRRIVHFDLKSPNILLTRDGTAKISDVGMAKVLQRDCVTGAVGTLAWAAPEMLWGERCTEKADIYSYGIVLWEVCTGERPVRGQLRDVQVPQECPAEVRALMLDCLQLQPSRRPSALQVVERLLCLGAGAPDRPAPRSAPADPPASAGTGGASGSSSLARDRRPADLGRSGADSGAGSAGGGEVRGGEVGGSGVGGGEVGGGGAGRGEAGGGEAGATEAEAPQSTPERGPPRPSPPAPLPEGRASSGTSRSAGSGALLSVSSLLSPLGTGFPDASSSELAPGARAAAPARAATRLAPVRSSSQGPLLALDAEAPRRVRLEGGEDEAGPRESPFESAG